MNWDDIIIDAAASDTGMRRPNNQDSYAAVRAPNKEVWRSRGHVFMVADGMGAHAVGELASKMACDLIPHNYMKAKVGTPSEAIVKAFHEVSARQSDFAFVAAAAQVALDEAGRCLDAALGIGAV